MHVYAQRVYPKDSIKSVSESVRQSHICTRPTGAGEPSIIALGKQTWGRGTRFSGDWIWCRVRRMLHLIKGASRHRCSARHSSGTVARRWTSWGHGVGNSGTYGHNARKFLFSSAPYTGFQLARKTFAKFLGRKKI